jgi:glycosyltransferase involved in cell wall biosynthesis
MESDITYSIVIPIYNEESIINELYNRLSTPIKNLGQHYEIIFVDDGSRDRSMDIITSFSQTDPHVKCISLSRNFGHQVAISAGIFYSSGKAVVVMDGDLQDPPEVIPLLAEKWKEGFDVVYAIRRKRKENIFKKVLYSAFYRILARLSYLDIPHDTGDFSIMDRKIVDLLNSMPEKNRFVRGIRTWIGFNQTGIEYEREARFAGHPKYSFKKLIALALDGIFSFSYRPLKFTIHFGFIMSMLSFLGGLFYFFYWFLKGGTPKGFTTLAILILFLSGIQFILIGIVGEYIGRIHEEVKRRPMFVIKELIGLENKSFKLNG